MKKQITITRVYAPNRDKCVNLIVDLFRRYPMAERPQPAKRMQYAEALLSLSMALAALISTDG